MSLIAKNEFKKNSFIDLNGYTIDKNEALFAKQLRPRTKLSQRILQWILNVFGTVYVLIEQFVDYPDDDVILGMDIDEDLQTMSRKNLCRYMDAVLPEKGFFDIQSTSKIRLGCQLLREYKQLKNNSSPLSYPVDIKK